MKLELNENDMMLTTIVILAGAVAIMALKSMEMINIAQIPPTPYYSPTPPLYVPKQSYKAKLVKTPEITQHATPEIETTISDVEKPQAVELSPVTFLGYNTEDDLVSVMKRLPNGEVMRRRIRDPNMSFDNL